jgi:hypothetical protein
MYFKILFELYLYISEGKSDENDEEGTISRPGSPKEGAEEAKPDTTDPLDPTVREKSAASVRIGIIFS